MSLWLETIWILLVAMCGVLAGRWASKHSSATRVSAMFISFLIIGLILLARQYVLWDLCPALRPIAAGRLRFILLTFSVTLGLSAPLSQLNSLISRFATCVIMSFFIGVLVTLPFLGPALLQEDLSNTSTRIDLNGVCRQSQPYTCGPAAAVTALKHFGFDADEGRLAVSARTSSVIGTLPWNLYQTLKRSCDDTDLQCSLRYLGSLDAIPAGSVALIVVKSALLTDHCVVVMGHDDHTVTVADPMEGMVFIPRSQFAQQWRNYGIILQRSL